MGIVDRIRKKIQKGASAALAPAPDPRVTHLTSHQKQRALRNQVSKAIQDVTAAKERLQAAADDVRDRLPALEDQARTELKAGRETMARLALQRRHVGALELQTLDRQLAEVEKEEVSLAMIEQRLSAQIEAFAARQEVIKARFSAAEAQVRINEAVTGVSQDFADLAAALQRAEETTESMQARATAIDQLVQEGDLDAISPTASADSLDRRLTLADADEYVERQLSALAKEVADTGPSA
jgi:phage shock protein A